MKPSKITPDPTSVFLNVPYDRGYERVFVTLVTCLVALGRVPRCVLEFGDQGGARLDKIIQVLSGCGVSIHDLSRPAWRLNMPFELGLACALSKLSKQHEFMIFETKRHRAAKTLSDLGGFDPHIHEGTTTGMARCAFSAFGRPSNPVDFQQVCDMDEQVWKYMKRVKLQRKLSTVFDRSAFYMLVERATNLAKNRKIID